MPHQISPHLIPVMISKSIEPPLVPPTQEEVSSLLDTIFSSKTSQASLDASYALTSLLADSVGFRGLRGYGVLSEIRKAAMDKKSGVRRESAMNALGALFEKFPAKQPISEIIFLCQDGGMVPLALDALADKGAIVRESAKYALDALFATLRPEALVVGLLPVLVEYLSRKSGKWQGVVGALEFLGRMADKAKVGMGNREEEKNKEVLRESMGKRLEGLIPVVEGGMHDLKAEVGFYILFSETDMC
jgi:elongation factor 3